MRHVLRPEARHYAWDRNEPAALRIESGDEVALEVGSPPPGPGEAPLPPRPSGFGMPLSGPILVEGAVPGDVIEVEIIAVTPRASGYTAIGPGYGLLPDDEIAPYRHEWDLSDPARAVFKDGIVVPIAPFLGVIGVAPDAPSPLPTLPPGRHGGNLDIRHLTVGARLWLPVQVEGAMLSAGDMHAAQGDGEVCGTAIETWGNAVLGITLRRNLPMRYPQFRSLGPAPSSVATPFWHCTTGIGPDLKEASAEAIREMIAYLCRGYRLSAAEAYALCSVVVDLRIAEIVDTPNWVVAACLPTSIFSDGFADPMS